MDIFDMLIIGGGPGGYSAAIYGARAGLSVLLLEKTVPGGQMALTDRIANYPGIPEEIDGFTLARNLHRQAERFGAEIRFEEVRALRLKEKPMAAETSGGHSYFGRTVVFAAGAAPRKLGLPEETALAGNGISYCASCDGGFFREKTVAVVGGGESAVAEALHLSRIAREVFLIHRRSTLRAAKAGAEALKEVKNITFLPNTEVTGLLHGEVLTGLRLKSTVTGECRTVSCDGLFISIGREPVSKLVSGQLELDSAGYVIADESTRTNLPGVFAVGDVRTKAVRQIVTAAADGAAAAHGVQEYLHARIG